MESSADYQTDASEISQQLSELKNQMHYLPSKLLVDGQFRPIRSSICCCRCAQCSFIFHGFVGGLTIPGLRLLLSPKCGIIEPLEILQTDNKQ